MKSDGFERLLFPLGLRSLQFDNDAPFVARAGGVGRNVVVLSEGEVDNAPFVRRHCL